MPPNQTVQFVRDFFFTDIMNHVEFLKWTCTLEQKDDLLLVAILERLAKQDVPLTPIKKPTFYGSMTRHENLPKNPLHVAKAYSRMQELVEHDWNVYEFAYLDPDSYRMRAFGSAIIQVAFFYCISFYVISEKSVRITPKEDGFILVVIMLFLSSILFFIEVARQRQNCLNFNRVMHELRDSNNSREIFLFLNRAINDFLGIIIFFFNMYFILISEDPTNAVLNSVALAFIIEIDDVFQPTWSSESIEDALAKLLKSYIVQEPKYVEVHVVKYGPENPKLLIEDINFYVHLSKYDEKLNTFQVVVYTEDERDEKHNVTLSYGPNQYEVSGTRSKELYNALTNFYCLEAMLDIVDGPKLALRHQLHMAI